MLKIQFRNSDGSFPIGKIVCGVALGALGFIFLGLFGFLIGAALGFLFKDWIFEKIKGIGGTSTSDGVDLFADVKEKEALEKQFDANLKAAEKGDVEACFKLAEALYQGAGIKKNEAKAFEWYQIAADKGHAGAMDSLGIIYYNGVCGIAEDAKTGVQWFTKAVENGSIAAIYSLAVAYEIGEGIEKDEAKALELYNKGAELENADAQYALGLIYLRGRCGVVINDQTAVEWLAKAANNGHEDAIEALKD